MFEKEAEEYMQDKFRTTSITGYNSMKQAFKAGAEFGYKLAHEEMDYLNKHWGSEEERKTNEWHYPSKGEYPECDENKKLWLYFKDYYANDRSCEYPIYRTSTGVYKTSFLNKDVKLFAEKSKGYESEILPRDIIAWMYIPEPPKDIE